MTGAKNPMWFKGKKNVFWGGILVANALDQVF